jgi:hypothetical protein
MGLLQSSDWKARWITPNMQEDSAQSNPAPMLRRVFAGKTNIASARLYVSAMGLYQLELKASGSVTNISRRDGLLMIFVTNTRPTTLLRS